MSLELGVETVYSITPPFGPTSSEAVNIIYHDLQRV